MEKIIFTDINKEFVNGATKYITCIKSKIEYIHGDIRKLTRDNVAFFSPANSFLRFGGGVDYIYKTMFDDIQDNANTFLEQYTPCQCKSGQIYLPVGSSAIINVTIKDYNNVYVVACPTMFVPCDIQNTKNVYWAFLAGLHIIKEFNSKVSETKQIKTLICPGLGTGCGGLSGDESAIQIKEAFDKFELENEYDGVIFNKYCYLYKPEKIINEYNDTYNSSDSNDSDTFENDSDDSEIINVIKT
jgi:O-acetyl-ADP-ribose deacetylase (regulator of RNase III)